MTHDRMGEAVKSTADAVRKELSGEGGEKGTRTTADRAAVARLVDAWPEKPAEVAGKLMEKYGPPNEAAETRLIWHANGPWKRTIVYRDEVPHNFPKPHTDLLEQFIDYRVPRGRFDDLAAYDGSVVPERTKGEISARCDMEEMNFLALNLAHGVARGATTVDEARRRYAEIATSFMTGNNPPETERLLFDVPDGGTADLDTPTIGPMVGEMAEQIAAGRTSNDR